MGMLIFERKLEGWFCSITEEWVVDTVVDALKFSEFLMKHEIDYSVSYSFELVHFKFEKSLYSNKDYKIFKEVVNELLDYKKDYGNCMDINDLKKESFKKKIGGK